MDPNEVLVNLRKNARRYLNDEFNTDEEAADLAHALAIGVQDLDEWLSKKEGFLPDGWASADHPDSRKLRRIRALFDAHDGMTTGATVVEEIDVPVVQPEGQIGRRPGQACNECGAVRPEPHYKGCSEDRFQPVASVTKVDVCPECNAPIRGVHYSFCSRSSV